MNTSRTALRSGIWLASLCLAFAGSPAARGQAPLRDGIDIVFLVDVSLSMTQIPRPGLQPLLGNDPQRIRWDAVLLSLNLLTSDDRVAIIPFNNKVPASFGIKPVPGRISPTFFNPRAADQIMSQIRTFIHNAPAIETPEEYNGDFGGTSILLALHKAREELNRQPDPGKERFVILLTDGIESNQDKPPGLEGLNARANAQFELIGLENDPIVKNWLKTYNLAENLTYPARIYTIGLGPQAKENQLLKMIAHETGGHYEHIDTNADLIKVFRRSIWRIKGYWTKSGDDASELPLPIRDLMAGIRDLGVLSYKVDPNAGQRNLSKLIGNERFTFKASEPTTILPFVVREENSYIYDYLDQNLAGNDARKISEIITEAIPMNLKREIHFSKRTFEPLFSIDSKSLGTSVSQYRPLEVAVKMDPKRQDVFPPSQFELEVIIAKIGDDLDDKSTKPLIGPIGMDDQGEGNFFRTIDIKTLEQARTETDTYALFVRAKGKKSSTDPFSLSGYTLTLPPLDFRVDNSLLLKDVAPIKLNNLELGANEHRIKIEPGSIWPDFAPNEIPKFNVEVVQWLLDKQNKKIVDITASALPIPLGGELILRIPDLKADEKPALGTYLGGAIRVVSADPRIRIAPLIIKYQATIAQLQVRLNRDTVSLTYRSGDAVASEDLHVELGGGGPGVNQGRPILNQQLTVGIPENTGFSATELWLQPKGKPESQPHLQSLTLPSESTFQLYFKPEPSHNRGIYLLQFGVSIAPGYDNDPEFGKIELNFDAPKFAETKLPDQHIQLGQTKILALPVVLKEGTAKNRVASLAFRNRDGKADSPQFDLDGNPLTVAGIEIEPLEKVTLSDEAGASPNRDLRFKVTASSNTKCGEYRLRNAFLIADQMKPQPVEVAFKVNDLEILDAKGTPVKRQLVFNQLKGKTLIRKVQVYSTIGNLRLEQVDVSAEGFRNSMNNALNKELILYPDLQKKAISHKDGRTGVEISLSFKEPSTSFETYLGNILIRKKKESGEELSKLIGCSVQRLDLLQTKGSP